MARTKITRRVVLASSIAVAATTAPAATGLADVLASGRDQAGLLGDHIKGLARTLSAALADHSGGRVGVVVRPAGYADEPVAFIDLAKAHDEAYSVSGGLVQAICAHLAAYAALGHASRAADAARLRREPTSDELARLGHASDQADATLMALCRYRARNGPERQAKAKHLLGFAENDELEADYVVALLECEVRMGTGPHAPTAILIDGTS